MSPARGISMIPGVAALAAAAALAADDGRVASTVEAARTTGWLAFVLLMLSLAVGPARRALGPRWRAVRRALGLGAAAAAAVHTAGVFGAGWLPDLGVLLREPQLRSGATALLVLSALAVTSFPAVLRTLRLSHWPLLHRAVYAAALLALHHAALSPHASPRGLAAAGVTVGGLLAARLARFSIAALLRNRSNPHD